MRPSITNGPENLKTSHCKLLGNLWGRFDLYFDCPIGKNLYLGRQEASQEEVWIKEYLLNDGAEAQRQAFQQLIDLNLKLGQGPDFRLVQLKDFATTPQACYLISRPFTGAIPLSHYLSTQGACSPKQVRRVLQQCLESLRYLHTACTVLWPTGSERGLCHGNLSLDSVWIRCSEESPQDDNFFVYVTDLALWDHIFWLNQPLATQGQDLGSMQHDLDDLGHIGLSLLLGQGLNTLENIPFAEMQQQSPELMDMLYRLTRQTPYPFRTTEDALQALRNLPELSRKPMTALPLNTPAPTEQPTTPQSKKSYFKQAKTVAGVTLGLAGSLWLGYGALQQWHTQPVPSPGITASYLLDPQGTWQSLFEPGEQDTLMVALLEQGHTLAPAKPTGLRPDQMTRGDIFDQLLAGQADFALMDNGDDIPADLQAYPIAYDAIVPFVSFSDQHQAKRATTFMGDRVSLTELRQVFTGELDTLNGNTVEAYFPEVPYVKAYPATTGETTAQPPKVKFSARPPLFDRFVQEVLGGDQDAAVAMAAVIDERRGELRSRIQDQTGQASYDIFTQINQPFNQWNILDSSAPAPTIGIGLDRLSRVRQQCTVYPLAVEAQGRSLQFLQHQGKPITPQTNLCRDPIQVDTDLIQQLATEDLLAYELVVVFPDTSTPGAAVAQLLSHPDTHTKLAATGMIPAPRPNP